MNDVEIVAGALTNADDPVRVSKELAARIAGAPSDAVYGSLEESMIQRVRDAIGPVSLTEATALCDAAALWITGSRAQQRQNWELVASIEGRQLPVGMRRTTGETFVGMLNEAQTRVRLVAPYVDLEGVRMLGDAFGAVLHRGAYLQISVSRDQETQRAMAHLAELLRSARVRPTLLTIRGEKPWPHLKVMTIDGKIGYVGSANLTAAALTGRSLELGILVRGQDVSAIDSVIDWLET
jgi:phosphatidylserine/phosphatidylglycerophosphate/cardiolipin synthase-like enzyme